MFKRSIKYLILILLNVLIVSYLLLEERSTNDVFDTDYVIDLLDDKSRLEAALKQSVSDNKTLSEQTQNRQVQLDQTRSLVQKSVDRLQQCESEQEYAQSIVEQQAKSRAALQSEQAMSAEQCSDDRVTLQLTLQKLDDVENQLAAVRTQSRELQAKLNQSEQRLQVINEKKVQETQSQQALLDTIETLENDLKSDLYIKKIYTKPVYCEAPRFSELICLERLLVRPEFSKKPISNVVVTLLSPSGKSVGSFTFDPLKAKLVNFSFAGNTEKAAGDYNINFNLDGIVLTQTLELRQ